MSTSTHVGAILRAKPGIREIRSAIASVHAVSNPLSAAVTSNQLSEIFSPIFNLCVGYLTSFRCAKRQLMGTLQIIVHFDRKPFSKPENPEMALDELVPCTRNASCPIRKCPLSARPEQADHRPAAFRSATEMGDGENRSAGIVTLVLYGNCKDKETEVLEIQFYPNMHSFYSLFLSSTPVPHQCA
uniref:Uncharacterized protein n=1 Tax=Steinernema glaseri TaxID=37863 RepID=A0A1I8AS02_9BILA